MWRRNKGEEEEEEEEEEDFFLFLKKTYSSIISGILKRFVAVHTSFFAILQHIVHVLMRCVGNRHSFKKTYTHTTHPQKKSVEIDGFIT
jgi:hypothetical protein